MSHRCPLDGYPLDVDTDWLGRTVIQCTACDRRRSGRCQDCAKPVLRRSWRCEPCKAQARLRYYRDHHRRHLAERRAKDRRYYAAHREEKRIRGKAWRAKNLVKLKRSRFGRTNAGYTSREAYLAYQREYNEVRKLAKREYAKKYLVHPKPTCTACGTALAYQGGRPPKWCAAHRPFPAYADRRKAA